MEEIKQEKVKYDNKTYYNTFKEKNKEKIHQKMICPVCNGVYYYYTKSKHFTNKKHNLILSILYNTKDQETLKIKNKELFDKLMAGEIIQNIFKPVL
jgi:hypothetical protein